MVENNPRPFWEDRRVTGFHCEKGYGHPSGHSSATVYTYITLYYEYCWLITLDDRNHNKVYKIVMASLSMFFIITVLYSRLILGVHSLD